MKVRTPGEHLAGGWWPRCPHLESLGLGYLTDVQGVAARAEPGTAHGRATEISAGKDTTTGHWEMMGIRLDRPFPLYPEGFPPEIIQAFERAIGRRVLGNVPASGTEIIQELGEEHLRTGFRSSTRAVIRSSRSRPIPTSFRSSSCTRGAGSRADS
jgi:phosphopentomutase